MLLPEHSHHTASITNHHHFLVNKDFWQGLYQHFCQIKLVLLIQNQQLEKSIRPKGSCVLGEFSVKIVFVYFLIKAPFLAVSYCLSRNKQQPVFQIIHIQLMMM